VEAVCEAAGIEISDLFTDGGPERMLSVPRRTLSNHIRAGILPARKIGKRTLLPVKDLKKFLKRDQPCPMPKPSLISKPGANSDAR
jgi:excisionase family DNA binding protein